jgi:hypothetical protein
MIETTYSEDRRKHLEFIQNSINRMNQCSSNIKQSSIILFTAIIGLGFIKPNISEVLLALISPALFWGLDSYYLLQERKYRILYSETLKPNSTVQLYDMDASKHLCDACEYLVVALSKTVFPVYITMITICIAIYFIRF